MTFSIIVPFLNEEKYIEECIVSLLAQDFPKSEYEIIFIDNGSTDNSVSIVKKFSAVKLLKMERRNVYAARNMGIETAAGHIIAFTDADCVVSGDWLRHIYRGMEDADTLIALGDVSFSRKSSFALKMFQDCQNARTEYAINRLSRRKYYAYTNNMAIRTSVFEKFGPLAEWPVPGDTEIIQRCTANDENCKVAYLGGMKVFHLEVSGVMTWLKKTFFYGKHNILIRRKKITILEAFRIYRYCFSKNSYSIWERFFFIILMFVGDVFYIAGAANGILEFLVIRGYKKRC